MTDTNTEVVVVDADKAMELLHRAAEEKGYGYIDPGADSGGCFNVKWNDEEETYVPSCIAGHAFFYAGVDGHKLRAMDGIVDTTSSMINQDEEIPVRITAEGAVVLRTAQMAQDKGATWGTAVDNASSIASVYRRLKV